MLPKSRRLWGFYLFFEIFLSFFQENPCIYKKIILSLKYLPDKKFKIINKST